MSKPATIKPTPKPARTRSPKLHDIGAEMPHTRGAPKVRRDRVAFAESKRSKAAPARASWYEKPSVLRPSADDHRQWPSIIGTERVWMDGRREPVKC